MTIRHLKVFIEVVETGKMSSAAKKLYIAQPSVSQSIRELETHYQTQLFERYSKKLYITEMGKLLYTYAKQVVAQFDLLEENMIARKHREKFRIGATISVGGGILSPIIRDFRQQNPDVDTYAFVGNSRQIEERLLNMELDASIVEGFIKSGDLITVPVLKDPLVLACCREHPLAKRKTLYPEDLENQEFAIREDGSGTRELLNIFLHKYDIHITVTFEGHTPDAIKDAVRINNCLTLISSRLLKSELESGEFVAFSSADGDWDRYFRIVYHKSKNPGGYIEELKNLLASYEQSHPLENYVKGTLAVH